MQHSNDQPGRPLTWVSLPTRLLYNDQFTGTAKMAWAICHAAEAKGKPVTESAVVALTEESRATVRKALSALESGGWITRPRYVHNNQVFKDATISTVIPEED